jgi:hypothetical protein
MDAKDDQTDLENDLKLEIGRGVSTRLFGAEFKGRN